jgi:nucleoside-diphosphate-sugar epimerase
MISVLVTGANGFIARHLAKILKQEGLHTVGISRKTSRIYCFDTIYTAYLGESLKSVFEEEAIDVVVHCAHHGGKKEFEANVNGTILWMEEARSHGVELQIFLSSLLAKTDALSDYGRAKFELEKQFVSAHQVVYRPGLVVGDGGMFGKMKRSIQKLPVVPLLDKGTTKVYVTGIEFLCYVIRDCILNKGEGLRGMAWSIQQPNAYTLREVMMSVRRQFRYLCWFIPVPSYLVLRLLLVVEKLPFFKLNIGSTNLKGLRQSGQEDPRSDFDMFGYPEEDLDALVKKIGDW